MSEPSSLVAQISMKYSDLQKILKSPVLDPTNFFDWGDLGYDIPENDIFFSRSTALRSNSDWFQSEYDSLSCDFYFDQKAEHFIFCDLVFSSDWRKIIEALALFRGFLKYATIRRGFVVVNNYMFSPSFSAAMIEFRNGTTKILDQDVSGSEAEEILCAARVLLDAAAERSGNPEKDASYHQLINFDSN